MLEPPMPPQKAGMSSPKGAGAPLVVSVQILNFEAGLYRMSFASERGPTDPGMGLPWARLEAPPGARPGQSVIAVQGESGWLSRTGDSALVQVTGNQVPLLLTIYQVSGASQSPEFEVQRLDVQAAATLRQTSPAIVASAARPLENQIGKTAHPTALVMSLQKPPPAGVSEAWPIEGVAHVQGRDVPVGTDGWIGVPGGNAPLEGFALTLAASPGVVLEYSATLGQDWSTPWARDGEFCGSRGLGLPILGLRVRLAGPDAKELNLRCEVRFLGGQEIGPMPVDELQAAPDGNPIEAFRFVVAAANRKPEIMPDHGGGT